MRSFLRVIGAWLRAVLCGHHCGPCHGRPGARTEGARGGDGSRSDTILGHLQLLCLLSKLLGCSHRPGSQPGPVMSCGNLGE